MLKAGRPPASTVYYAKSYPEWKLKVLEIMRNPSIGLSKKHPLRTAKRAVGAFSRLRHNA